MIVTPGQKKLQVYLETHSQTELSKVLAVKQASVSAWAAGKSSPEHVSRVVLEVVLGIPSSDWFTEADQQRIQQARDLVANRILEKAS